ncbi:chromosomal replication initiator protein DnaA [Roseivirga echinicomitans]|uniref:Chromosomal replication initiator protein DnaA n=1 Tax=Roseivirga echinicomitans TaxID=296218 RepID=A0A150XXL7_9BACT|nr:chromosomal replication initiator protein DnaA [Roseivirga echinicomitans]KYG83384.1 chromosomal replication initiation protein DnaA [Roseivirga echinicomitans]
MVKDCVSVWEDCLRFIRSQVGDQSFKTWFEPIVPLKLHEGILTIQVPSQFFYEYLEEHYVQLLRQVIHTELGPQGRLEYSVIVDSGSAQNQAYSVTLPNQTPKNKWEQDKPAKIHSPFDMPSVEEEFRHSNLNPNYDFENYIEGDCNRLARSAGIAVAEKPGVTSFNPLMVYGGVGLGKTHLIQSIGNKIRRDDKKHFVLYVSSEKFTTQFTDAIKNNSIQSFTNFYLQVDTLIIDDVQFFSGKEKTQEMFFHIFNHLHQSGKQIIMSSDRPPRDLKGLQDRLLSRFKWGLTADLQMPDFETRIAIISRKMESDGIYIPDDVVEYLAYSVDTNVRELEGVLISLIAHATLNKAEINLELAKQTLKNIVHDIESEVGVDYIQKSVGEYFQISVEDLKDKTRKKEIVIARQVAMYLCKEYTNHSLKSIGYHFGGRDHSTVIHAVQSVSDMIEIDTKFCHSMDELKKKMRMKSV